MSKFRANIFLYKLLRNTSGSHRPGFSAVCKILTFKFNLVCLKSSEFRWLKSFKEYIFWKLSIFEALYFLKMCPIFVGSEVVCIKNILALNLLIYIHLHSVRMRLSWSATTWDTLMLKLQFCAGPDVYVVQ